MPTVPSLSRQTHAQTTLALPGAPRVFSRARLVDWLEANGQALAPSSLTMALATWRATGLIEQVAPRAFLNLSQHPRPRPAEAAAAIQPGAVVSLAYVLGEAGVLNNPSPWVTATVPLSPSARSGSLGAGTHRFRFAVLPPDPIDAEHPCFDDAFVPYARFAQATPEKAWLDWQRLAQTPRGQASWPLPPAHDLDLTMLDADRLERLAQALGVADPWLRPQPRRKARSLR